MAVVRKRWRWLLLLVVFLTAGYAITRLTNLGLLPIFTDEAIYIRWSQIGSRDANWRFISLTDGKQPLFTWLVMVLLRFPLDPLLAGRLVSVAAGALSLVGIWWLTQELFRSRRISFLASLLYLVNPFSLMYDRMALYDSLVATFSIWNLYLAILLVRTLRLDVALILGMTLGAGMLNKTSGFLSLYLLPLSLLLFDISSASQVKRLGRWLGLVLISAILSQALYSILRLSPFFYIVAQKDTVFVYTFAEWLTHPFRFLIGNLRGLFDWLVHYLTWPVFIVALLPLAAIWSRGREKMLLLLWWLAPFVALASFGRVLYPRFILFMAMPLLPLAAVTVAWVWRRWHMTLYGIVALIIIFAPSVLADYFIMLNPTYAPIPQADKGQYIDDWPAGGGVRQVNNYLAQEAKRGRLSVYTEGTFGLLPYAIEIYLVDNPNIKIRGIWPLPKQPPAYILADALRQPTYLILNESQVAPSGWPLTLVAEYQKGTRQDRKLRLYKITPVIAWKS